MCYSMPFFSHPLRHQKESTAVRVSQNQEVYYIKCCSADPNFLRNVSKYVILNKKLLFGKKHDQAKCETNIGLVAPRKTNAFHGITYLTMTNNLLDFYNVPSRISSTSYFNSSIKKVAATTQQQNKTRFKHWCENAQLRSSTHL